MANKFSDFSIRMNPLVKLLMNSPLHWVLSSSLMLIRFKGRKSGKEFVTPVGYRRSDDCLIILLTETHNRQWWRNYRQPWPMDVKYKGRWRSGEALWIEPGSEEYVDRIERIFKRAPFIAKIMKIEGFDADDGLRQEQLEILLENTTGMVKYADEETDRG
jgi:hypothetical protein